MEPLNRQWFYRGFHKTLKEVMTKKEADEIWHDAALEYREILSKDPGIIHRKGAMVLPSIALYRALKSHGKDAVGSLTSYGEKMGKRFAGIIHILTGLPGADRLVWRNVNSVMKAASSEKAGYKSEIVSDPPRMYGVDILSCPYHELAKELGDEEAVLCICHMDKEYSKGFRHIRYERNSAVSEGARACEYRLSFDVNKD